MRPGSLCLTKLFSLPILKGRMPSVSVEELISKGFLQLPKRGRPRIYATPEESYAVKRAQQKECARRHTERVREARELLRMAVESSEQNVQCN